MSTKFLPATFTRTDFSDHPDRELVGPFARYIVDGLFGIPGLMEVTVNSGSLVLKIQPQPGWWVQHKSQVEIALERALEVDEVTFTEGV